MKLIKIDVTKDGDARKSKTIKLTINTQLPIELCCIPFTFDCASQYAAELLQQHISKLLNDSIEQAHKLAYEAGWRDAKLKRRKRKWFSCYFAEHTDHIGG